MNRRFRTGAVMTVWATYGALWVVAVLMGRSSTTSQGTLRWALSVVATLFLQGTLYVVGLFLASAAQARGVRSQRQVPSCATVLAALVTVGALIGLVASLRVLVFGGPAWLTWVILGLAAAGVVIGSGRAMGWAALGGLIWSGVGLWSGIGQDPVRRADLMMTCLLVGVMAGAVGGTLWGFWRGRKS